MKTLLLLNVCIILFISCDPPNDKNTNKLFNASSKHIEIPNVELERFDTSPFNIKAYLKENDANDKITLICFWATWCGPCSLEFNDLKQSYHSWQSKYNFELLGISIDEPNILPNLSAYVNHKGWPFEFCFDTDKSLSKKLNIDNIPRSYLIDRNGKVVHINYHYYEGISSELEAMLKKLHQKKN